ncbi:PXA domain-containing protein [Phlyctema vagabunda]|uniref:PXA domain-containing protein n=1 Tax=Phlyctema vagabunda TaxID=108571 RepID=A0ABR4PRN2_9HELO
MTAAQSRAPTYLQPRLKSSATSNTSTQSASASAASASTKPASSRPDAPVSRQSSRPLPADPLSERATTFLIRRTLCSHLGDKGRSTPAPVEDLLPPLTSSNDVDLQLYALIAIIIKEFVYTWYGKITPDQVFVEEVVKIIAHCTRALEQRLRKVDLESLLLDELPDLLDVHVRAYRTAHYPLHPGPVETDPREIYHSIWPFPALSPVPSNEDADTLQQQAVHESAYRQLLVQGVLAVLLPTEDLENECLTTLVGQIFSEMILGGGIGGKACEPWMLWEGITKIGDVIQAQLPKSKAQVRVDRSNSDPMRSAESKRSRRSKLSGIQVSIEKSFWLVLQYAFVAFNAVRFLIISITTSSSLPSRIPAAVKMTGSTHSMDQTEAPDAKLDSRSNGRTTVIKQPIITMKLWSCVSRLLDLDVRMPWLSATISMIQWGALTGPGELGNVDGMIDKYVYFRLYRTSLSLFMAMTIHA